MARQHRSKVEAVFLGFVVNKDVLFTVYEESCNLRSPTLEHSKINCFRPSILANYPIHPIHNI